MPQAASHIFVPLILLSLFRDYYISKKSKKKFPLHYVLIGGISGIIPDLDVALFWIVSFFGISFKEIHRTFLHSIFIPLIFLILGLIFFIFNKNIKELGKHKLKLSIIFFLISFGIFTHLILDAIFAGKVMFFYPFSDFSFGLDLFGYLPKALENIVAPCLDAALIIIWLIYIEWKHKISDFI